MIELDRCVSTGRGSRSIIISTVQGVKNPVEPMVSKYLEHGMDHANSAIRSISADGASTVTTVLTL